MSQLEEFEKASLTLIRKLLAEMAESFDKLKLTPVLQELSHENQGSPSYSSEVTIYFWDSTALTKKQWDLADVIEFHVVKNGKPNASLEQIEEWIRSDLKDVSDRRKAGKHISKEDHA